MRRIRLVAVVALGVGCGGEVTAPPVPPAPPAPEVTIVQVAPGLLGRGDSVQIVIRGDGFDAGSTVEVQNDALAAGTIRVLATEFRSATELAVTVQVSRSAPVARYDVRVKSGRGRRGIGNERIGVELVDMIGTGATFAVNEAGVVVGELVTDFDQATRTYSRAPFVRFPGHEPRLLPLPGPVSQASARAINAGGVVIGQVGAIPSRWTGVDADGRGSWEALIPWTEPPWLGGEAQGGAINDAGAVAGYWSDGSGSGGAFCWSPQLGARRIVTPWGGSIGVVVGLSPTGDAFGRASVPFPFQGGTGNTASPGDGLPFVVHCHDGQPTLEQLPLLPGMERGWVSAVAPDGTLYGGNVTAPPGTWFWDAPFTQVRWTRAGPDRWVVAAFRELDFVILGASAGGRLVGRSGTNGLYRAWLWDPSLGRRELAGLELNAFPTTVADRGPGSPMYIGGGIERHDGVRAVAWPSPWQP